MNNLTEVYNQIAEADVEILEKQAAHIKVAEEEDAAGRIMARGFADELTKIAGGTDYGPNTDGSVKTNLPKPPKVEGGGVKVKPPAAGGGNTGGSFGLPGRGGRGGGFKPPVAPEPKQVSLKRPGGRA